MPKTVSGQDYSVTFAVDQSPKDAFAAITNVRGWWSGNIEGRTDKLGEEFTYRYEDIHYSKQKITELVPGKKVVWDVLDSYLSFVKDKTEWNGTKVVFEISKIGDKTEVRFTHLGLVPQFECYNDCTDAWRGYIRGSLRKFITKGKGQPNPKE
jgi:Activator of Hsp90 ATPase homolog 1-like protein